MTYRHIPGVTVSADFSADRQFRYRLDIVFNAPHGAAKTACVVMQNPSKAGEEIADKSVQFMEKNLFLCELPEFYAVRRLIIVNQFARIQTNHFNGEQEKSDQTNDAVIRTALHESHIIIIAWGKTNRFEERKKFILGLLGEMKGKGLYQTRTHPSRGCYKNFIQSTLLINGRLAP